MKVFLERVRRVLGIAVPSKHALPVSTAATEAVQSLSFGCHLNPLISLSRMTFALTQRILFRERVRRVELLSSAWKAEVIPIYDTRSRDTISSCGIPPDVMNCIERDKTDRSLPRRTSGIPASVRSVPKNLFLFKCLGCLRGEVCPNDRIKVLSIFFRLSANFGRRNRNNSSVVIYKDMCTTPKFS